ncbi:MAG: hypothetical protein ACRCR6_04640, partial [Plesiomonas sp.]
MAKMMLESVALAAYSAAFLDNIGIFIMHVVCETARLRICHFTDADTAFILQLLNQPAFVRYIGDKQVRDE